MPSFEETNAEKCCTSFSFCLSSSIPMLFKRVPPGPKLQAGEVAHLNTTVFSQCIVESWNLLKLLARNSLVATSMEVDSILTPNIAHHLRHQRRAMAAMGMLRLEAKDQRREDKMSWRRCEDLGFLLESGQETGRKIQKDETRLYEKMMRKMLEKMFDTVWHCLTLFNTRL